MGASPEAAADLGQLDQSFIDRVWKVVNEDRKLRWTFVQRGFWVHGVDNLRDYFRSIEQFTMDGRAEMIGCPTLLIAGADDPLAVTAHSLFDALRCQKELIRFTAADGAGDHCEMRNRSMLNRRAFDWLDGVLRA